MPRGDRGGKVRIGGIRCVAANCGNTNADGFSLHYFVSVTFRSDTSQHVHITSAIL